MTDLEPVLAAAWDGLRLVLAWPNVLYPVGATLVARVFAFLPGLSGNTLLALAVSLTLAWEPLHVMLVFGAFVGAATFMGSVTAILFNVPGSGPSAATLIDGHPLARAGKARTALGAAALSSALGSTFGIAALILLVPLMRAAVLALGSPELLLLIVWGLATLAVVTRGSVLKGLAMAGIGLLLSFVGQDPRTGEGRFTFGLEALWDGLALAPILIGLFSVAEVIDLAASGRRTISGETRGEALSGSAREGMRAVLKHLPLVLRSSFIGTLVGVVPGLGGTVAGFVAYARAVQGASDRSRFGHGDIRGVIAPEAAHDAKDGGSLVPTLAFGIPGSDGTALLLAALVLHGFAPGRELMTNHLTLVFVLIWSLFLSNWLTSAVGLIGVGALARFTLVRTTLLAPLVLTLAVLGAFAHSQRAFDVLVAFSFGFLGYFMKKRGWPRIPLVIALTLGGLFEMHLHITTRLVSLGRIDLLARPIAAGLLLFTVADLALPWIRGRHRAAGRP
ncbi:MAG TPA: tripartite tricarboxylate transporter permease [Vicinamibacteria bacterium]|nr:tripartite tricarboxylate transporter permease [Vicinamibacteria bacterium]